MKNVYLVIAVLFVFASCTKEETPKPQTPTNTDTVEKIIQINTSFSSFSYKLKKIVILTHKIDIQSFPIPSMVCR
jgi:hypothetical protein